MCWVVKGFLEIEVLEYNVQLVMFRHREEKVKERSRIYADRGKKSVGFVQLELFRYPEDEVKERSRGWVDCGRKSMNIYIYIYIYIYIIIYKMYIYIYI